ncbi:putative neutral sphingomyelinase isoform X2 [Pseudomyrmex gracilis]|uniref:putative neutral sphingomyelinase isoform X2 n=1 Tax=Pseudomyrmex gracilis TaxID=219809 RepID=UPI000994C1B1|nr:putative neutral sphingomyelinase isoform X2 [Pseudomyrmex gracilis]
MMDNTLKKDTMANEISMNILTLNCWGIPYVSKNKTARMHAIADKCASSDYDIICLQEVWSFDDFNMIKAKVQEVLPYFHYFFSGVFGSGICILSRYPIHDVMFHKWPLNGYVHKIQHADWFGGKGVGLCKINIRKMNINIYVAHLHAEYNRENDEYIAHRVLQAFDTAQFVRMTSGGTDAVILVGDLNTEPGDLAYRIIRGVAGLTDACPNSQSHIGTNECANNSYTSSQLARTKPEGKRIDHILYVGSKNVKVDVMNFEHPLPNRVPYKNFSYSDHEGVMATLKFGKNDHGTNVLDITNSMKEALEICEVALKRLQRQRCWYLLWSCILLIPLVWSIGLNYYIGTSIGIDIGLNIARILLTAILCYTLFMSTIWNSVEKNALKAGYSAIEIFMAKLNDNMIRN